MELNELHDKLFEMLMAFDRICRENNIRYFLDSGCAIGAVREHDFIPWDDDVDVAMERPEFERLKTVLAGLPDFKYKFIEPEDYAPYFFDFVPKLIDISILLREETDEDRAYQNYQNRMSIDIFILDSVPDSAWTQRMIKLKCKVYYALARSKRYALKTDHMSFPEKVLSGIGVFLGRFFSLDKIMALYQNNTTRFSSVRSHTLIRSNSLLHYIGFYRKDDYRDVVYLPFHGTEVPLPAGYDSILRQLYGDYMTPARDYKGFISHLEQDS